MQKKERVLIVAAHPDDEVLGCGGAIIRHCKDGDEVRVLIVAQGITSRYSEIKEERLKNEHNALIKAATKAAQILGVSEVQHLDYPDNRLDTVDRLTIIRDIEAKIEGFQPTVVYVHHAGDVNIDHRRIHEAVVTACRPMKHMSVKKLLSYEVPSSTEWQTPGSAPSFMPNYFIDISECIESKLEALEAYESEMRDWPHPRSMKGVEHLNRWRGAQVGFEAAEGFMLLRAKV